MALWDESGVLWDGAVYWDVTASGNTLSYLVDVDVGRDETFSGAGASLDSYVLSATWQIGMADSYDEVAAPARLTLTLDNKSGVFFPEDTGSAYYNKLVSGTLVRIRAVYQSTLATLWVGKLVSLATTVGTYGEKIATIVAEDQMLELLDVEYAPKLQTSVTTDTALQALFDVPVTVYPYAERYFMLDVVGSAELGSNTTLFGDTRTDFETGITTLAYVGDNADRGAGVSAQGFIRDIVASEVGGRFFWDARNGQWRFHDRRFDVGDTTVDAAYTAEDFDDSQYIYGQDLLNKLTVTFEPRVIGDAGTVLWQIDQDYLTMKPSEVKKITARYRDTSNPRARVGAQDTIVPVAGTDYLARTSPTGGEIKNDYLVVSVAYRANSADITLTNSLGRTLYVTLLQLRGTPIYTYQKQEIVASDPQSIADYSLKQRKVDIPIVDDEEFAQGYAELMVDRFKEPTARYRAVSFVAQKSATRSAAVVNRAIGDRISIASTQNNHDRNYIIVGEQHQLNAGGDHTHQVTWILQPAQTTTFWRLSDGVAYSAFSVLGSTTRLDL